MSPEFLELSDVIAIHEMQIARFGGASGVRDHALLDSALAQPRATFDGESVHTDLVAMAAAYLYHLVSNHPFVDGNKRVGLACALVFLDLNDAPVRHGTQALYELTMDVASGTCGKSAATDRLREIIATGSS